MPPRQRIDEWHVVYGLIVLAVSGVLLFKVNIVLSPIVLYFLLLLLMSPYAGTQRHLLVVLGSTFVLFLWLLATLGSLLAPFILALGIAYILDPAADRLEARGMPRTAAVASIILPVLAVVAVLVFFGIPALIDQIESLVQSLPDAAEQVVAWLQRMRLRLARSNLPFIDTDRLAAQLSDENIAAFIQAQQSAILEGGWRAAWGVGRRFGVALTILGYVVLTPVLVVYLLRDFNKLTERAGGLIPEPKRATWFAFLKEYDRLLARFLRGQVVAATIVGVLTWLGLWIVGFPYAGLVGAIAGVFNIVPYLGLIVSIVPVLVIALISGSIVASLIKAGIIFAIVQFIDGSITGPRIVGESVGLHPVWVILALAVGSVFFGFVGLLLAMPAAVFVKLALRVSMDLYRASRVYRGAAGLE